MVLSEWTLKALIGLGSFLGGSLVSLSVTYVIFTRDISFIKGQLQNLLKVHDKLSKLYDRMLIFETEMVKAKADLNHAHEKIRELKNVANR